MSLRKAVNAKCKATGCGQIAVRGEFCNAHYIRWRRTGDANSPRQRGERGGGTTTSHGYRTIALQYEHILIAEKALGHPLPTGAEIHHVNENKADNRGENLVICPNHAYHMLLHRRARAYDACGHANWIKCGYCGDYDAPENLAPRKSPGGRFHSDCAREYNRRRASAQP